MKTAIIILGCMMLFGWSGCSVVPEPSIIFDKGRFDQEWAAWEAQGIVNYTVVEYLGNSSTGPLKARIVVKDNEITQIDNLDKYDTSDISDSVKTVSELYAYIAERYEKDNREMQTGVKYDLLIIDITYNEQFHYPEKVSYHYFSKEPVDGGGGWSVELTEFEPLTEP